MTPRIVPDDAYGRAEAVAALRRGEIVAIPTDTVYGIAVALDARFGIERLFAAKSRPPDRAIMVLVDALDQVADLVELSPAARELSGLWPGGLTLVLPLRTGVELPAALTAGGATLGVRVPDHECPRSLARAVGPIPATSANPSGEPAALDVDDVVRTLGDRVDLVLDGGRSPGGLASSVVDCSVDEPSLIRPGAVSAAVLAGNLDSKGIAHRLGDDDSRGRTTPQRRP